MRHWLYVCIDLIASKLASIFPNLAYVTDQPKPGLTVKAGQRGLLNLMGRGFGGNPYVGPGYDYGQYQASDYASKSGAVSGEYVGTDGWREKTLWDGNGRLLHDGNPTPSFGGMNSGHSFLSIGEYYGKALSVVKPHEELEPLENDHLLRRLIQNPNPYDTFFSYTYEKWMFSELTGVSYEWLVPNRWGVPCERWVIPSHWVWPRTGGARVPDGGARDRMRRNGQTTYEYEPDGEVGDGARYRAAYVPYDNPYADRLIQYYEVRPWGGMGSAGILRIPPNEIVMTKWPSPINKIDGYSKLAAIAQWIDSEESISKSRWAQFQNQARPELWVKLPPGYEDADDNRIARIEAKFLTKWMGELNYGKPIFTSAGTEIEQISFTPTEMAYFDSENQLRDMILSTFRVPHSAVGIVENMTYGSILATLASLCSYCLDPRLTMAGENDTKHLASRWDEKTPAYSNGYALEERSIVTRGHGGSAGERKVRIWFDDCLDMETECLTAEGWKRPEELTEDARIACYDPATETIIYRKPERIVRRDHDGVLYLWEGGRVNAAMTPRHRVYVQTRPRVKQPVPSWGFRLAVDLQTSSLDYRVRRAAPVVADPPKPLIIARYAGGHQQLEDGAVWVEPHLWLEFIGYYVSEGHARDRGTGEGAWTLTISQAEDNASFARMKTCINALPFGSWSEYRKFDKRYGTDKHIQFVCGDRGIYEHLVRHCGRGSKNKKLPDYVKSWPAADLQVLLDALIAGDGRVPAVNDNTGIWNSQYATVSRQLADDVMEIAVKCGLAASITAYPPIKPHQSPYYVVSLSSRTFVQVLPSHRKVIPYRGPVWCVTVETGAFVVRRRGKAHITGNCVPADPSQVNSDLETDGHFHAVTPNEVRALRGRKPYRYGGDDPFVQGPAGPMPYPMNTKEDLTEVAELLKPMAEIGAQGRGRSEEQQTAHAAAQHGATMEDIEGQEERVDLGVDDPDANGQDAAGDGVAETEVRNPPAAPTGQGRPHSNQQQSQDFHARAGRAGAPPRNPNGKPQKNSSGIAKEVRNNKGSRRVGVERSDVVEVFASPVAKTLQWEGIKLSLPLEVLAAADFVRLPGEIEGTNCTNCKWQSQGMCWYPDLAGQEVNASICCKFWDSDGTTRPWQEKGWCHPALRGKQVAGVTADETVCGVAGLDLDKGVLDSVQSAGRWLASKWSELESRYGRKQALAMAAAMLATSPLPGSIPAIIAVAEGVRGIRGYFERELKGLLPTVGKDGPVNRLLVMK